MNIFGIRLGQDLDARLVCTIIEIECFCWSERQWKINFEVSRRKIIGTRKPKNICRNDLL